MKPWTLSAVVVATILFVLGLSSEFYNLTSPKSLSWHVLLRKFYSVVAFALVGYLFRKAMEEHHADNIVARCIAGVATYSAAIEAGQLLLGSTEGLGWNAFDVLCGAVGGALGAAAVTLQARVRRPR